MFELAGAIVLALIFFRLLPFLIVAVGFVAFIGVIALAGAWLWEIHPYVFYTVAPLSLYLVHRHRGKRRLV